MRHSMARRGTLVDSAWGVPLIASIAFLLGFVSSATNPGDVRALQAFKASLVDTSNRLRNWQGDDPCGGSWKGVHCVVADYPSSLTGSDALYVTELRLLQLNLQGQLAPEIGDLSALKYLNVMWNRISGSIPTTIGRLKNLRFLLLSGNLLTGVLPQELGFLPNLTRLHVDENMMSGPLPSTFVQPNLLNIRYMYMNNNSLNGSIAAVITNLSTVQEVFLDNNQFTGGLPATLASLPNLSFFQLDNNPFDNYPVIPQGYGRIAQLVKLSLRNCSLRGAIPAFSLQSKLAALDLSHNSLSGSISNTPFSAALTTIDLSYNQLSGSIPENLGFLPALQFMELRNNNISGLIPANIGSTASIVSQGSTVILDLQNNSIQGFTNGSSFIDISRTIQGQTNLWLSGNPFCNATVTPSQNSNPMCAPNTVSSLLNIGAVTYTPMNQGPCGGCSSPFSLAPVSQPLQCRCAIPMTVQCRLKSPSFGEFDPYEQQFTSYLAAGLQLSPDQVQVVDYAYQPGPRLLLTLRFFPTGAQFDDCSQILGIYDGFALWKIPTSDLFGPYELISFVPPAQYSKRVHGLSAAAIGGIVVGAVAFIVLKTICMFYVIRTWLRKKDSKFWGSKTGAVFMSRRPSGVQRGSCSNIKVTNVKEFSFWEMAAATEDFSLARLVGEGGYGKVYSGVLENGQKVAVKRAEEGSHQGTHEFETEIQMLSRVHHRNLVSLVGYCNDEGEQMLVYEFITYGSLQYHLSSTASVTLNFLTRLQVAVGSARGIHYLHTQANPPIYHRDVKASNILLDENFHAKVADFGLSRLAPYPDIGGNVGHVSTVVKGTPGYLDPEYFKTHRLTEKSDVYSFGMVILVLFTGLPPITDGRNLVREVNHSLGEGEISEMVDYRIRSSYPPQALDSVLRLALLCCEDAPDQRPNISEVLVQLEQLWTDTYSEYLASGSGAGSADADSAAGHSGELRADHSYDHSADSFIEINPSISSSAVSSTVWTNTASSNQVSTNGSQDHVSPR